MVNIQKNMEVYQTPQKLVKVISWQSFPNIPKPDQQMISANFPYSSSTSHLLELGKTRSFQVIPFPYG